MKKKTILLISLILLVFSQSLPGEAREESKTKIFSLMPFVGYHSGYEFGTLIPLPNTADVPEITVQTKSKGVRIGFSLGYQLAGNIELQGTFFYGASEFQNDVGIGFAGIPLGIDKISDSKSFSYSGNILYSVPIHCLSIYMTGGLGAVSIKPDILAKKTRLLLNFGAGITTILVKHLRLFLDVRDYVSFFDFAQDFGMSYAAIYEQVFKKSQHHVGIHFGLGYVF
ncbi:MAG: porin family protein [Candidatus Aminicenantes bacterium]|nr:porin family protein [Candidatus Aminicenantes bacterium]